MKRLYLDINPQNLIWVRECARYSQEKLEKRVEVGFNKYHQWESGNAKPTIHQVYDLVRMLNRPKRRILQQGCGSCPRASLT